MEKKHFVEFINGETKIPLKVTGKSKNNGTKINFLHSKDILSSAKLR